MPDYSIEARSLSVAGVAGHNYWVLRDPQGNPVAELHGLATDRETGRAIPIGTDSSRHSLRIWHYVHDGEFAAEHGVRATRETYIKDDQPSRTVLSGSREEVLARWNAAVAAKEPLNALDLDYPNYGFKVFGGTVNSNSAYRTLGEIMGVPVRDFPWRIEPGIDNRMTTPESIERLRTHDYPVLSAVDPRLQDGAQTGLAAAGPRELMDPLLAGARAGDTQFADALRELQRSAEGQQFQERVEMAKLETSRELERTAQVDPALSAVEARG